MASVLENLRQATQCLMCRENREELKILKCFHVFCVNCLTEQDTLDEDRQTFSCATCKTITTLPQRGDFSSLATSGLHSHIAQVLSLTEGFGRPPCSCAKRNPSTLYCYNCHRYLCEENCIKAHEVISEDHRVLNLSDLQDQDYKLLFRKPSLCKRPGHTNEVVKYYCKTCESCICEQCLQQDHRSHDKLDLETAADRQNMIYREKLNQLHAKETEEMKHMERIESVVSKTKENAEDIKTQVRKSAEDLVNFIEENKRDLLRQVDEEVKLVLQRQEEQKRVIQLLRAAREHISNLNEYANSYQVIDGKDLMEQRLEELCAMKGDLDGIGYNIDFTPSTEMYNLQELGIGSVTTDKPADASKCTVELESDIQGLQALNKIVLSVSVKDSRGKLDTCPGTSIYVGIEPNADVKDFHVSDNVGGKCRVEFVPKVPGHFTVTVMVNDKHASNVSNCPLGLDVKPQELKFVGGEFVLTGMDEPLKKPCSIAVNKANTKIAITDSWTNWFSVFDIHGKLLRKITFTRNFVIKDMRICLFGIAFLNDDDVIVTDWNDHRVLIFDTTNGRHIKSFGRYGWGPGEFKDPRAVNVDGQGRILVCDESRVQVFTSNRAYLFQIGKDLFGKTFNPEAVVSHAGLIIVCDYINGLIHVVDQQQEESPSWARSFLTFIRTSVQRSSDSKHYVIGRLGTHEGEVQWPNGLAVDSDGNLLVCEDLNGCIQKFTLDGRFVGKTCEKIYFPYSVAVLADGRILTCTLNNKIRVVCGE